MAVVKPIHIRASLSVWGAGPGLGGSSYIEFSAAADGWHVFCGGSATDGREQLGSLPVSAGWRERIAFIFNDALPAHEDHSPSDVMVTGARGVEAAMLKMAWSGESGARAAATLLCFKDDELASVLDGDSYLDCVNAIQHLHSIVNADGEVEECIRAELRHGAIDWGVVVASTERITEKIEKSPEARDECQAGIDHEVAQLLETWCSSQRVATQGAGMIRAAKGAALQSFLARYVKEHNCLPTGQHVIPVQLTGQTLRLEVNFDDLSRPLKS